MTENKTILIVDDSFEMLEVLYRHLTSLGYQVFQASHVNDAIEVLNDTPIDLLITDLQMPGIEGMELVKYASEHYTSIPILVVTGFPSVAGAVEALKSGAMEYLVKPFIKIELKSAVEKALGQRKVATPNIEKKNRAELKLTGLIGESDALTSIFDLLQRIKDNRATVLITGESGTGKEVIARAIHYSGSYAKAPFIAVNCGAIPENLLESELFGFVKGSFTGANETRAGFFQAADGGTIFLDEIGNASQGVQARLLRVIQEKEIMMIGATRPQKINVRIVTATNKDLYAMVQKEQFREDLYYRLNVVSIQLPPLRERKGDIPLLANHFIFKYAREFQKNTTSISSKAMHLLERHSWPGNIRELENVMQSAIIMADGDIDVEQLPDYLKAPRPKEKENVKFTTLKDAEKAYILKVLQAVNNNKTKAAEILGIDRKTLRLKLK